MNQNKSQTSSSKSIKIDPVKKIDQENKSSSKTIRLIDPVPVKATEQEIYEANYGYEKYVDDDIMFDDSEVHISSFMTR
jgi:hypothetical protein